MTAIPFLTDLTLPTVAILFVAAVAATTDLRTRRIPNVLTFPAAAAAFGYFLAAYGLPGLGWSAAGWAVGVLLFLPFFALGGLGAGDVKLLGALGAWLGPIGAVSLSFHTAIAGGVAALIVVLASGAFKQSFKNLWLLLMFWRTSGVRAMPGLTLQTSNSPRLAYGVPIALGALITLWRG